MQTYAITPAKGSSASLLERIETLATAGLTMVQIRERELNDRDLLSFCHSVKFRTRNSQCKIIVNDRLDIAFGSGADGIHLGSHSIKATEMRDYLPKQMLLGVSCHNQEELAEAERAEADFVTFSPVFQPRSKEYALHSTGVESLKLFCQKAGMPVYALGGMDVESILELKDSGCSGIAAISLFFSDEDIQSTIETVRGMK